MRARRALVLPGIATFVFVFHCGSDDHVRYEPEADARFAASVLGQYVAHTAASGDLSLTICEDAGPDVLVCVQPDVGRMVDCGGDCHHVRGDGHGEVDTFSPGGGCDCPGPYGELAVRATLADLGSTVAVATRGSISLSSNGTDGYAGPSNLLVYSSDDVSVSISGAVTPGTPDGLRGQLIAKIALTVGRRHPPTVGIAEGGADGQGDADGAAPQPSDAASEAEGGAAGGEADGDAGRDASVAVDADGGYVSSPASLPTGPLAFVRVRGVEACR